MSVTIKSEKTKDIVSPVTDGRSPKGTPDARAAIPEIQVTYGSLHGFLRKFDIYARRDRFIGSSRAEFIPWREKSKETLFSLLGLEKMEGAPLEAVRDEAVLLEEGITREHWLIQTEPGVILPFYLLIPERITAPSPFLCPAGHGGAGKYSVAGLGSYGLVRERILRYHYDYGLFLARHGFVTLCPDARGFGERREYLSDAKDPGLALLGDCRRLSHMGNPLGIPVAGMLVWDLLRCIDFLSWRGEWDLTHLGCLGFSGGGMQTLFLSALEERVRISVVSGYLYGYRDSLLRQNENCSCNYVPHLWEHFDMGDLAGLIAPRPLVIVNGLHDTIFPAESVQEQTEIALTYYKAAGCPEKLEHVLGPEGHRFYADLGWPAFDRVTGWRG
ncbi:MAG: hypothetical protein IIZ39_12135 [Blautia sp.]|nr:hypothetical protein [Blautia sp.]